MDELVARLCAEMEAVTADVEPSPDLDERFSVRARRGRQRQKRTVRVIAVLAVLVVAAAVALGVVGRSSDRTLFVGQPSTTAAGDQTGPSPAANVEPPLPNPLRGTIPDTGWLVARTGRTDRELVVYVMGLPQGCGDGYLAKVETHPDYVAVTLAEWASTPETLGQCAGPGAPVERAVLVSLPEPLAGRRVVDGARPGAGPDAPGIVVDGTTLRVPGELPDGYAPQVETLTRGWAVCYSDDATCKLRTNQTDGQLVPLLADLGLSWTIDQSALGSPSVPGDLRPLLRDVTAFQTAGAAHDPVTVPVTHAEVNGNPAVLITNEQGHRAIVWTDGRWWFSIDPTPGLVVADADLIALADSMHTVGALVATTTTTTSPGVISNCGIPYWITSPDGRVAVGSCSGNLSTDLAADIHLRVGESLSVDTVTGLDESGNVIAGFPTPDSSAPDVLAEVAADERAGTSIFAAKSVGEATLTARTPYCLDSPSQTASPATDARCPVARVTVTP